MMIKRDIYKYDIVVIGGGISGCEASNISAKNGARILLLSINTDSIGYMAFENYISNAKGIAAAGKSIWNELILSNTARINKIDNNNGRSTNKDNNEDIMIIDRKRQTISIKEIIENQKNVEIRQGLVINIETKGNIYQITANDGLLYKSKYIILAPGTFLESSIFWGSYNISAGRPGEIASNRLLRNLVKIGFKFEESILYSSPKIDGRSLDLKKYIRNIEKHKFNIIPEGIETNEMYVDGFKTDKNEEEQLKRLRKIKGFENVIMTRPGYGIKYNILSPLQINKDLESKNFPGLFFCGRINGLFEYELTALQGYLAGLNVFKKI